MKTPSVVWEIARWEFFRWFKWKDQFLTVAISLALSLIIWSGTRFLSRDDNQAIKLAVIGHELLALKMPAGIRIDMQTAGQGDEQRLRELVGRRELDGLLVIKSADAAELLVYKEPVWKNVLEERMAEARTQAKIQELQIPAQQLAEALRPVHLSITIHQGGQMPTSSAEKIAAGLVVCVMLLGTFVGAAYQFVAITGEKQLRVTEMIMSAVTPQQWIDGKIIGVSAYALAFTFTTAISVVGFVLVSQAFNPAWALPVEVTNPAILLALMALGLGGFILWNTIFAAISATINDPNTSARGSILMVPFVPVLFAMFAFKNPDSLGLRILSFFPLTSPAVLPARLVLTTVAWWEVVLAVVVVVATAWFFRSASGRIFRLGMLMHGKEPGFKEMLRWAREA